MTLSALRDRILAATGPDRELDALICAHFRIGPVEDPPGWVTNWAGEFGAHPRFPGKVALLHTDGTPGMHWTSQSYTGSIDAALALVGAKLPDWRWSLDKMRDGKCRAFFIKGDDMGSAETATAYAPATALAICGALLTVLSEQGEGA